MQHWLYKDNIRIGQLEKLALQVRNNALNSTESKAPLKISLYTVRLTDWTLVEKVSHDKFGFTCTSSRMTSMCNVLHCCLMVVCYRLNSSVNHCSICHTSL